jgi:ABC-type proline/glycine betaine transport system ATPase subunit
MESDKVLVLDKGRTVDFEAPKTLLKNPESHFTKLVNQMQDEEKRKELEAKLSPEELAKAIDD